MRFDVLTLFPEMFHGFLSHSIMGKAKEKGLIEANLINFRQFSDSKHNTVDDTPYGGGGGMVLRPQPIFDAVDHLLENVAEKPPIIMMTPQGEPFSQEKAEELSIYPHLVLLCGHYEGFDERIRQHLVTHEISMGDYVLTGGELPAMIIMDSVSRLLPDVLGNPMSHVDDSFSTGLLEYPHYTKPSEYRGLKVPDILLSGHHANIDKWRREQALLRTWERRPDLLKSSNLTEEDRKFLRLLEADQD
ncbi:tRNA (guanosine(37)-N1)-methyltransferase TrmD [Shimazuella alba]|uniref:tRNA (guanine-N(1)-)-methyltransferase n=1 Tax=Shimazuella alba TaxID=2690964 RepID=A0A6I4VNU0_9BACL|nr:tRNA (guanosine(37)-N1)-methyltransferase TrmD [Shimazuella alba]